MLPRSAETVVERMRHSCLDGIRLVSDRQPTRLRVDEHTSGLPSIWLHPDGSTMAWIIVDIGERDWSRLAYQFGHELGHVMANSWGPDAKPTTPSGWLEEALVEAFSLHGLGRLAESWKKNPPFANDGAFGEAIADYRRKTIQGYSVLAQEQGNPTDFGAWFKEHRDEIESAAALSSFAKAASLTILNEYEKAPFSIEALGALNRWPARGGVPLKDYFRLWETSCAELSASRSLPGRLQELLRLG